MQINRENISKIREIWRRNWDFTGIRRSHDRSSSIAQDNRTYNTDGGDDPKLTRIYKTDQGRDAVIDVAGWIDRTRNFQLKMTLAEFGHLFDGSERLISVETIVWYVREVYNP